MKRFGYISWILVAATVTAQLFILVIVHPPVFAADPVCYQREPANYVMTPAPIVTRVLDCGGTPNFHEIEKNVRGHDLEADKCYIVQAGIEGITNGDPFGSDVCNAAEGARIDKGTPTRGDGTPTTAPETPTTPGGGTQTGSDPGQTQNGANQQNPTQAEADAALAKTNPDRDSIRNCNGSDAAKAAECIKNNPIYIILQDVINFVSALVGIVVIGAIIAGGIQYSASHGDPNTVAKAKSRIMNALIAFVAYIFLYAFLQWLIPGGPF